MCSERRQKIFFSIAYPNSLFKGYRCLRPPLVLKISRTGKNPNTRCRLSLVEGSFDIDSSSLVKEEARSLLIGRPRRFPPLHLPRTALFSPAASQSLLGQQHAFALHTVRARMIIRSLRLILHLCTRSLNLPVIRRCYIRHQWCLVRGCFNVSEGETEHIGLGWKQPMRS